MKDAPDAIKEYVKSSKDVVGAEAKVSFIPKLKKDNSGLENFEGEWFFEENLRQKEFEDQLGEKLNEQQIQKLKEKLKALTNKFGRPSPYFAILKLDGDFMGEWLSGERLPSLEYAYNSETWNKLPNEFKGTLKELTTGKKILTPAIHASISHALRNYSLEFVRKIVEEEHLGKLVYSGGDDVLAFVNLKDLYDVMQKLRAAFSGHIKFNNQNQLEVDSNNNSGFVEKDGKYLLTMGSKASASMGVVIAHYKTPLKIVIDKVREMEKKAKDLDKKNKDAFGVALMKHSGQFKEFICKWRTNDNDVLDMIKNISNYFKEESKPRLSRTFPYKLYESLDRIKDKEGKFSLSQGIFDAELKRVLLRSIEDSSSQKEKENMINKLSKILPDIFWMSGIDSNLVQFFYFLEIAKFIAKPEV